MLSAHPFWSLEVPRLDGQLLLTPCPGHQQVALDRGPHHAVELELQAAFLMGNLEQVLTP